MEEAREGLKNEIAEGTVLLKPSGITPKLKKTPGLKYKIYRKLYYLLFIFDILIFYTKSSPKIAFDRLKYDIVWNINPAGLRFRLLCKKLIVSFWDPFVFEFLGFEIHNTSRIFNNLYKNVTNTDCIITQSQSNFNYLTDILGVNPKTIHIIENGSPNYRSLVENKKMNKSDVIKIWAEHARNANNTQSWVNASIIFRLLSQKSDKPQKIIFVSTQDRPYKGFHALLSVFDKILLEEGHQFDFNFVFTGEIKERFINSYSWAVSNIFSLSRVPTKLHASLYSISELCIHPSFCEGGLGSYPMFEAASLGIPSLSNLGRHMLELETRSKKSLKIT